MECELINENLVHFYFGTITTEARRVVEKHFLNCPRCLADFLEVKRNVEVSPTKEEMPDPSLKSRIVALVRPRPTRNYLAASGSLLALSLLTFFWLSLSEKKVPPVQQVEIDSARENAVALNLL